MLWHRVKFLFLPTPSARRATHRLHRQPVAGLISTHALREEGDGGNRFGLYRHAPDFYPRPPRGGRHLSRVTVSPAAAISTHALREEGDLLSECRGRCWQNFYPRPPRGGRPHKPLAGLRQGQFLPTPSARRATSSGLSPTRPHRFLPTPSARRATLVTSLYHMTA